MAGRSQITDKYGTNYLSINSDGSIDTNAVLTPSADFPVEIKDATTDTRVKVKTDGTDNALVVMQNIQPLPTGASTSAKQLLDNHNVTVSNEVTFNYPDENTQIKNADDAVTTINYVDSNKDSVTNISTASSILTRKVTDTYDNSGATTLIISSVVADV